MCSQVFKENQDILRNGTRKKIDSEIVKEIGKKNKKKIVAKEREREKKQGEEKKELVRCTVGQEQRRKGNGQGDMESQVDG